MLDRREPLLGCSVVMEESAGSIRDSVFMVY